MQESDDRLEVDDLADAWDLGAADEIVDDADDSRLALWADASARWARGHRRAIGIGAAVVVLASTATLGWMKAHPPTLAVPALSVSVDAGTSGIVQSPDPAAGGTRAAAQVVLAITADVPDDVRVTFEGMTGLGVSMPVSAPSEVADGTSTYPVAPTVDCVAWQGSAHMLAAFHITDGRLSRDITVPVRAGEGDLVGVAVADACASYYQEHPLRVLGVSAALDPVHPVVNLTWTVRNTSNHGWTIDGEGTGSDALLPALAPRPVTSTEIEASRTQDVTSSIAVTDCASTVAFTDTGYSVTLSASHGQDQTQTALPAQDIGPLLAAARRACDGAPAVSGAGTVVSVHGVGASATTSISVHADVAGTDRWSTELSTPTWWDQTPGAAPFPVTTGVTQAPGPVALTVVVSSHGCLPLDATNTMTLVLHGAGRAYPFAAPLDPSSDPANTSCAG